MKKIRILPFILLFFWNCEFEAAYEEAMDNQNPEGSCYVSIAYSNLKTEKQFCTETKLFLCIGMRYEYPDTESGIYTSFFSKEGLCEEDFKVECEDKRVGKYWADECMNPTLLNLVLNEMKN